MSKKEIQALAQRVLILYKKDGCLSDRALLNADPLFEALMHPDGAAGAFVQQAHLDVFVCMSQDESVRMIQGVLEGTIEDREAAQNTELFLQYVAGASPK